ncbi:MAG TPA: RES family NAD+ phosphorylase [Pyrinomonadaceae bacterium]|jgi:RES domain-containing protein
MSPQTLEQRIRRAIQHAIPFEGVDRPQGICFRNVKHKFANLQDILSTRGSFETGGRYNFAGAFGVLYLACDAHTCLEEVTRVTRSGNFSAAMNFPRTFIGIKVKLSKVLDLTDPRMRRRLGVSRAMLVETNWELAQSQGSEVITQSLGRLARAAGFEAVLTPSAAWAGNNLNIFPENILPSSELSLVNEAQLPSTRL